MTLFACLLLAQLTPVEEAVRQAERSGRVLLLWQEQASLVPPGAPPVLTFRYLEGSQRRRFGDTDLVVDDAGH